MRATPELLARGQAAIADALVELLEFFDGGEFAGAGVGYGVGVGCSGGGGAFVLWALGNAWQDVRSSARLIAIWTEDAEFVFGGILALGHVFGLGARRDNFQMLRFFHSLSIAGGMDREGQWGFCGGLRRPLPWRFAQTQNGAMVRHEVFSPNDEFRITAADFCQRLVAMIRLGKQETWRQSLRKYRSVRVDGMEFLNGKANTLAEFNSWIDGVSSSGGRVLLTSATSQGYKP